MKKMFLQVVLQVERRGKDDIPFDRRRRRREFRLQVGVPDGLGGGRELADQLFQSSYGANHAPFEHLGHLADLGKLGPVAPRVHDLH